MLMNFFGGGRICGHTQHLIPQGTRTHHGWGCRKTGAGETVDLPVEASKRLVEAGIAQRHCQHRPALVIECQLGGQLVEMGFQFGMKLQFHMLAKHVAQTPAGNEDGGGNPEQRTQQQTKAQRAAQGGQSHCGLTRR
jgi:hypothetical protein